MISPAGTAFTFVLAFALLYYCKVLFSNWYRKGYDSIARNTVPVLPKFASDGTNVTPVAGSATQKGTAFEGFVATRFSKDYFRIEHWRSDKYVNGVYALSNRDPDLEMVFQGCGQVVPFAVECKWRSAFTYGSIDWAKSYQVKNYKDYQRRKYMHVFIVIGIGGTEGEPKEMYIIPLMEIGREQTSLSLEFMRPFRRNDPSKDFSPGYEGNAVKITNLAFPVSFCFNIYICAKAPMPILPAQPPDIPLLVQLVNSAYRGSADAVQGWTNESHLLAGNRIDADGMLELMNAADSVILKYVDPFETLAGCVYLQKRGDRLYLGLLCVSPALQGMGLGKELMAAAVGYARKKQCTHIYMTVISARHELVAWYERHGYQRTGETEPFHAGEKFGIQKQPLELVILAKELPAPDPGAFTYEEDGFTYAFMTETRKIRWAAVERIVAYKQDIFTADEICLDITYDNWVTTFTEETPGWYIFLGKIKEQFPGIPNNWDGALLQPPFATNPTVLYERERQLFG